MFFMRSDSFQVLLDQFYRNNRPRKQKFTLESSLKHPPTTLFFSCEVQFGLVCFCLLPGEIFELKAELNNEKKEKRKEAVKKVIAAMTVGKDVR